LATTTSFIAGQVTLEILKYVSTKIEAKRLFEKQEQQTLEKKSNSKKRIPTPLSWLRQRKNTGITDNSDGNHEKWRSFFLHYLETHSQYLLQRFRNCFINLSTNDISFVQPVEKQKTTVNEFLSFHLWEDLSFSQKEININTMTIKEFLNYFRKVYDIEITSILYEGRVVYHTDLLIDEKEKEAEEEKTLREVLNKILRSEEQEEEEEIKTDEDENEDKDYFESEKVLRLEITVISLKKTTTEHRASSTPEEDRTIPPVLLEVPSSTSSKKNKRRKSAKKTNAKKNRLFSKWFSRSKG
jgi:vacuolar-type H+-ATPase subunit F/Vma7